MPITARYVLMASMDVDPDHDAIFNEVYDQEHVPFLLEVPGVLSVTRATAEPLAMMLGGERREMPFEGPRYTAIYEIESPDVVLSPEWAAAVERGRWPSEVRPYTRNRQHKLFKVS
ncbi:MAG: DUF4286 family protein [Thalassobaculum sp.]|uniref:hypothetical protein n=1 Tax=Thalassobaculum sp. TaxID=2022740 RepID=UPI0032EEB3CA